MGKENRRTLTIRLFLQLIQHTAIGLLVLAVVVVAVGSTIRIDGLKTSNISYKLYASDQTKNFEESDLFLNILDYGINDIIRFGVIRSQLETNGEFDGKKMIDVTAYNFRDNSLPNKYVTIDYYLEDLLKWFEYGFEYKDKVMTRGEYEHFLADKTRVKIIDSNSKYYNTTDETYLKSDINSYSRIDHVQADSSENATEDLYGFVEDYVPANGTDVVTFVIDENYEQPNYEENNFVSDSTESVEVTSVDGVLQDSVSKSVLVNRYKSVEGKNIEDYVSNWSLYEDMCSNIVKAAKNLKYNYDEYLNYKECYASDNSNLRYYITKTVNDKPQVLTNMPMEDIEKVQQFVNSNSENPELFSPDIRYIYYNPSELDYQTNTTYKLANIKDALHTYDYAYPENIKIWISVDTTYQAKDAFSQGALGYRNFMPHYVQWIVLLVVSAVIYLFLLLFMCFQTGNVKLEDDRKTVQLNVFDKVPTEIALLIGFGCFCCYTSVLYYFAHLGSGTIRNFCYEKWFYPAIFIIAFLSDALFCFFFYSLIRRIKAKALYKNSLLHKLVNKTKKIILELYDNINVVARTIGIYTAFLLFNVLMGLWAVEMDDGFFIPVLIAIVVDAYVGYLYYKDAKERENIVSVIEKIADGEVDVKVSTEDIHGDNLSIANAVNSIGNGIKEAVETSMRDERMKADLITNVSHDIKTPLTSIINYVDLIKREKVDNSKVEDYIRILDEKSQRLKQLTDDLVEASKISSGNIILHFETIQLAELINQTIGEFSEKFEQKNLTVVLNVNTPKTYIEADSRRIWRVVENLFNNICKYALEGTRVYIAIDKIENANQSNPSVRVIIKNISESPLNCDPNELTERFIRGDVSRTTEGSGLGLSIAKSLTEAQKGSFEIRLDGDLFKVILTFPEAKQENQ